MKGGGSAEVHQRCRGSGAEVVQSRFKGAVVQSWCRSGAEEVVQSTEQGRGAGAGGAEFQHSLFWR